MFFTGISDEAGASIERQIAAHQALGWRHLELRGINGKNLTDVDDDTFAHVVAAVEAAGMSVCSFASQLANWGRPITTDFAVDEQELARAIPRMHRLNTPFIRCMSYPNNGLTDDAWRDEVIRRLRVLARMAQDGGVTLVHENCDGWGGHSAEHTLEMLERVDSPALKLVYDTGNPIEHEQNAVDYLRAVIDHVVHIHIKDGKKVDGKTTFTFPNEGDARVDACIRLLIEHGYDGGYSIEPHIGAVIHLGSTSPEEALWDSYTEYGRRLMAVYEKVATAAV